MIEVAQYSTAPQPSGLTSMTSGLVGGRSRARTAVSLGLGGGTIVTVPTLEASARPTQGADTTPG